MNNSILQTRDLAIGYPAGKRLGMSGNRRSGNRSKIVAEGMSLELREGELVCLLGPNGSGKSTLMRTLAGVQKPLGGEVLLSGTRLDRLSARDGARLLSLVLTDRVLTGNLSVYALVALGRYPYTGWAGNLSPRDEAVVRHAIETTGTRMFAHRHLGDLSDGERQKVMIARAIAQDTPVIMLDEPTAHLDLPNRLEIVRLLKMLAREQKKAIVLSTHELDMALQTADRIWLMRPVDAPHGERKSSIVSGIPESLVLDGQLEQAFRRKGFEFDLHSGSFRFRHDAERTIGLVGDGVRAYWTRRALERIGCRVVPGTAVPQHVVVAGENGTGHWQFFDGSTRNPHKLQALSDVLTAVGVSASSGEVVR